ncbi:MAG TPA: hypothetical protein VGC95_09105 [Chitinophagaceae bacterium]
MTLSRLYLLIGVLSLSIISACTDFGKRVQVPGTKSEVFYLDNATSDEALKVGNFLKGNGFINDAKPASIQLDKKGDDYTVRFVYNRQYFELRPWLDGFFRNYGVRMSQQLFGGHKVDVQLTDKYFSPFKSFPYDTSEAGREVSSPSIPDDLSGYDHRKVGDVSYFWQGLTGEEVSPIVDYVSASGLLSGGAAELYITRENDRYILRFPVKPEYLDDALTIGEVEKVAKMIKSHVFPTDPFSFKITDEKLQQTHSFDY